MTGPTMSSLSLMQALGPCRRGRRPSSADPAQREIHIAVAKRVVLDAEPAPIVADHLKISLRTIWLWIDRIVRNPRDYPGPEADAVRLARRNRSMS